MYTRIEEKFIRHLLFKSELCPSLKSVNFEKLVKISSSHLLIPSIYLKLNKANIKKNIPKEFLNYSRKIYNINKERNKNLISEISEISEIFKKNKINHVFMKGSANLISGIYQGIGERMIGDIDILIQKNQIEDANQLLKKDGYFEYKVNSFIVDSKRHLPRLIKKGKIFAVELHKEIFEIKNLAMISPTDLLKKKCQFNGVWVPNAINQYLHNIYNFQINDRAHYKLLYSYRTIYDSFLILKKHKLKNKILEYDKFITTFLMVCHELKILNDINYNVNKIDIIRFRLKYRYRLYSRVDYFLVNEFFKLKFKFQQINKLIFSSDYRKYLICKYLNFKNFC